MQAHAVLMNSIKYEYDVWYFPLHAVWANIICTLSFKQQIHACFYASCSSCNDFLSFFFVFFTYLKVHSSVSHSLLLSVYNTASPCKLNKRKCGMFPLYPAFFLHLPSCLLSLLPRIPVHHMLPWVLICLHSSSSHSGGLDQHIRSRCNANLKHQPALNHQRLHKHIVTSLVLTEIQPKISASPQFLSSISSLTWTKHITGVLIC